MENNEITKINKFLTMVSPLIVSQVKMILQSAGLDVQEKGCGADLALNIKSGEKEIHFSLYNLLYEIATIDRDEKPLRFDSSLRDFNYFRNKANTLIQSKLRILFELFAEEDVDLALERVTKLAKQYQRVRILKFDPKNSS